MLPNPFVSFCGWVPVHWKQMVIMMLTLGCTWRIPPSTCTQYVFNIIFLTFACAMFTRVDIAAQFICSNPRYWIIHMRLRQWRFFAILLTCVALGAKKGSLKNVFAMTATISYWVKLRLPVPSVCIARRAGENNVQLKLVWVRMMLSRRILKAIRLHGN